MNGKDLAERGDFERWTIRSDGTTIRTENNGVSEILPRCARPFLKKYCRKMNGGDLTENGNSQRGAIRLHIQILRAARAVFFRSLRKVNIGDLTERGHLQKIEHFK